MLGNKYKLSGFNTIMKKQEIVILIGHSGVGKSVVGSLLAQKIKHKWVDSDIYLHDVLKFPRKISYSREEFERKKELELEILKFVLSQNNVVFSAGEGLLVNQNEEYLSEIEKLLIKIDNVELLYKKGQDLSVFLKFTKKSVCVDGKSVESVVDEVSKLL